MDFVATACQRALDRAHISGDTLLVAVSGGRDSCVLLAVLHALAEDRALRLVVGHVDHGLRGADSDADAGFVAARAEALGLDCVVRRVDVPGARAEGPSRTRPSPEEAARDLRRAALEAIAREVDARWIATAHHAGDQAETVLLRLLRGTGPDGLGAMRPITPDRRWLRPLLAVEPVHLGRFAEAAGVDFRVDATNADPDFTRNRLRNEWIPGLAREFNPRLLRALCNLAETQSEDREWIDALVDDAAGEWIDVRRDRVRMALEGWEKLPAALAHRLLRRALEGVGLGREISRSLLVRLRAVLVRGAAVGRDKRVECPRGFVLRRVEGGFELAPERPAEGIEPCVDARVRGRV